jgi:HlyD family secretion protein
LNRIFLVAAAIAAGVAAGWFFLRPKAPVPIAWQGYAEADFVRVGPTQQGLVTALHVARGDRVEKDQPLFEQDDADDRSAVAQADYVLQQARDQLANLQNPGKATEIEEAVANLRDAEATRDKVKSNLNRDQSLLTTGAVTKKLVENEQDDLRSATAKISAMQALLDQSKASMGRRGEITAQTAAAAAAQAALVQAQWRLAQRSVVAPAAGVIADVLARPGETLAAGAAVVSLLPPQNIFVRFFVREPELASVHIGDRVGLACDGCARGMTATVSFISPQAEYTPPFIYSESTSNKFVFLAQATPTPSEATRLNPGEPVTVAPQAAK